MRPLVILGAGKHATSVANVALSAGYSINFFVDAFKKNSTYLGIPVLENLSLLENLGRFSFAIAIGHNFIRERVYEELIRENPGLDFPCLIHSSAVVSSFAEIKFGSVVMPKAVVGPNSKIGSFCIVNTSSSLDHDCLMSDFSSIAPAGVTGGSVALGRRANIAIGAVVKNGVTIGHDSIVGANSYLNQDLPNNCVAYGTPCKVIRGRLSDEPYLE